MPTTITSAGITFNDATSQTTSALAANAIGTTQIAANAVTAAKLGTNEQKQICKAWVNFNGTGTIGQPQTIRSSYSVSSITKNGTGDYTVNFATAMADANYSATISSGLAGAPSVGLSVTVISTISQSSVRFYFPSSTNGGIFADTAMVCVQIFGN